MADDEQFWVLPSDELSAEAIGHIFKAAFTSPPGTYTYEPAGEDRFTDCPACGTAWAECEASHPYADEEDPACCEHCEHEWIPRPAPYTVSRVWSLDKPEKPPAPHLEGGPWSAIEALRGSFVPWKGKP